MGKSRVEDMGGGGGRRRGVEGCAALSLPPHFSRLSSLFSCIASLCPLFSSLLSLLSLPPSLPSFSLCLSLCLSLSSSFPFLILLYLLPLLPLLSAPIIPLLSLSFALVPSHPHTSHLLTFSPSLHPTSMSSPMSPTPCASMRPSPPCQFLSRGHLRTRLRWRVHLCRLEGACVCVIRC